MIEVTNAEYSTTVEDEFAIDAEVRTPTGEFELTLVAPHSGYTDQDQWVTWGDLDNWIVGPNLDDLNDEELGEIVQAVNTVAWSDGLRPW